MRLKDHLKRGLGAGFVNHAAPFVMVAMQLCWAGGCNSVGSQVGAAAAPAMVRSGLYEVNAPEDQQQLQRLADSPAFQHAALTAGEGVGVGLFDEANKLAGGDFTANLATDAASPVGTTGPGTTRPTTMPAHKSGGAPAVTALGGGLNGFVQSSVQAAFLAATDPQFKAGEQAISEAIGEGFVSGMIKVLNEKGPELADTIRRQLGPIVQELIREQIAPAVRDMLQQQLAPAVLAVWKQGAVETLKLSVRPDLQPDVQQNAQNVSIGAGHGTNQMLIESGLLAPSGELTPRVKVLVWSVAGAAGLILLALFTLLVMLNVLALHHWRRRNR